ncbi:MAG: hypothetical protein K8U57_30515 [Planctomycetes bacterium]|nr:hypothetical protein [Planctomycetota bacterium]
MTPPNIRVNWTIPAPVILALLGQVAILAFLGGSLKTSLEATIELYRQESKQRASALEDRLAAVERTTANGMAMVERVKGVEVRLDGIEKQSTRIENKLDTVIERKR